MNNKKELVKTWLALVNLTPGDYSCTGIACALCHKIILDTSFCAYDRPFDACVKVVLEKIAKEYPEEVFGKIL